VEEVEESGPPAEQEDVGQDEPGDAEEGGGHEAGHPEEDGKGLETPGRLTPPSPPPAIASPRGRRGERSRFQATASRYCTWAPDSRSRGTLYPIQEIGRQVITFLIGACQCYNCLAMGRSASVVLLRTQCACILSVLAYPVHSVYSVYSVNSCRYKTWRCRIKK
jgi:hypothetical protein